MLFNTYLFADYSGAKARVGQRNAIRLAHAEDLQPPVILTGRLTRAELVEAFLNWLRDATTTRKARLLRPGPSIRHPNRSRTRDGRGASPMARSSRGALRRNVRGQAHRALIMRARLQVLSIRGSRAQGRPAYFYSATKSSLYGIPAKNPRSGPIAVPPHRAVSTVLQRRDAKGVQPSWRQWDGWRPVSRRNGRTTRRFCRSALGRRLQLLFGRLTASPLAMPSIPMPTFCSSRTRRP